MSTIRAADTEMAYRLTGEGNVTIVITQGLGFASAEWWPIQDMLSGQACVLTWDRPGYGESTAPHSPRTVANIAGEALELIDAVAPDRPLVLVGHSQGGLYSNELARLAGARIRGVLLLDPASPDNGRLRRELPPKLFERSRSDLSVGLRMARRIARLHLIGLFKPILTTQPPLSYCSKHPPEALDSMWRHLRRAQAYETALAEYEELEFRTTPHDLEGLGPFPQVPLEVLVHDPEVLCNQMMKSGHLPRTDAEAVEALWGTLLREQRSLSPLGKAETVVGSGHLIHLEKPELTVDRIQGLLTGALEPATLTPH